MRTTQNITKGLVGVRRWNTPQRSCSTLQHLPTHTSGSHRTYITMATTATTATANNTVTNEQEVDNSSRWTRRVIFVAVVSCLLAVSVTCALLYSAHQAQQTQQQQQQPLVSVVVVTYNRAAFLPRTLRGILSQGSPLSPSLRGAAALVPLYANPPT